MVDDLTKPLHSGANMLKFFLMPFVCFACFGLPGWFGNHYIAHISRFAPAAFFILCGYFATEDEVFSIGNSGKLIRRTALRFVFLIVVYLALDILNHSLRHDNTLKSFFLALSGLFRGIPLKAPLLPLPSKRDVFSFAVLCVWPYEIGKPIWFIQSLLYVRIALWIMDKLKLMRYYKPLMIIGFAAMLFTGELASAINFRFLGYHYFAANWFTYALPYMLLGRLIHEKSETLLTLPMPVWVLGIILGVAMTFVEFTLLKKYGNLVDTWYSVGFCVMAFSACCLFLEQVGINWSFFAAHGKSYAWRIYALMQPVGLLLPAVAKEISDDLLEIVQRPRGILIYAVCLVLAFVIGFTKFQFYMNDGGILAKWRRWQD